MPGLGEDERGRGFQGEGVAQDKVLFSFNFGDYLKKIAPPPMAWS